MSWTGHHSPSGPDWALLISALSLLISAALALREFSKRPQPIGHIEIIHRFEKDKWVTRGFRIVVGNLGQLPLALYSIGRASDDRDGTQGPLGEFEHLGEIIANPELPLTLQPGELVSFVLPDGRFSEGEEPFRFTYLKRRRFLWRKGQSTSKVVAVNSLTKGHERGLNETGDSSESFQP